MSEIKYFRPLTVQQVATKTENAYRELTYLDLAQAISDISEAHTYREPLVKEARRLIDRDDLTPFEAILYKILYTHLRAQIELEGE
jgi:hypothetical protein